MRKKYIPKMITVDLSKDKIDVSPMRADLIRDYIGGEGIGSRLLWEMVKPKTEPSHPGNAVVFASAPFNGTIFPAGARGCIVFKSPESEGISMFMTCWEEWVSGNGRLRLNNVVQPGPV